MKTVICIIDGEPQLGDEIRICYTTPRGGRTDTWHTVGQNDLFDTATETDGDAQITRRTRKSKDDVLKSIAKGLASNIGIHWMGEAFQAVADGTWIVISCADAVNDASFWSTIEGKGTFSMSVKDFSNTVSPVIEFTPNRPPMLPPMM